MSLQIIRDTAQDLVNYVATHMKRPDVAANLQQWHFAMISKHVDIVANDIKAKEKELSKLKIELQEAK